MLFNKSKQRPKYHDWDRGLVISVLLLCLFGIIMAFSAGSYESIDEYSTVFYYFKNNVVWFIIGWVALYFFSMVDYHRLRKLSFPVIVVVMILLVMLVTLPSPITKTLNGATRWINLKIVTVMPGELIKPALILFFAAFLSAHPDAMKQWQSVIACFALIGIIFVLIIAEPNLSTACIVAGIGIAMLFIGGLSPLILLVTGAILVTAVLILVMQEDSYWGERIISGFNPWSDPTGGGYQIIQSLLALGSGGIFGKGLGNSTQKTLYLPEPQSDFILPIIGEELGFITLVIMLGVYLIAIARTISIAVRSKDSFGTFIAGGTAAMLSFHVILNVLVVTATFPTTGVFLPFISQGGNATLCFLAMIGITLNVSRQTPGYKNNIIDGIEE